MIKRRIEQAHDEIPFMSEEMNDLIKKLLTKDPDQRPSIDEILELPII